MDAQRLTQLICFLQQDLALPSASIKLALQHPERDAARLPMILWQYGLITLTQLDRIFDWMEEGVVS